MLLTHTPINAMRILAIEPVSGKSHWNFMSAVIQVLTENGHDITAFTPFPDGDRINYTEIDISNVLPMITDMHLSELFKTFCKSTTFIPLVINMTRYNCQLIYESYQMKSILNVTRPIYDIVIGEISASECLSYAAAKLNLPLIYLIPSPMITHIEHDLFGHYPNPATVSNLISNYRVPITFFQRLENFIFYVFNVFSIKYVDWVMQKTDPQPYDLINPIKPSLVFTNTHYITEASRPLPPNIIEIGGIHLKPPIAIPQVSSTKCNIHIHISKLMYLRL